MNVAYKYLMLFFVLLGFTAYVYAQEKIGIGLKTVEYQKIVDERYIYGFVEDFGSWSVDTYYYGKDFNEAKTLLYSDYNLSDSVL